jgi:hypothetical protein
MHAQITSVENLLHGNNVFLIPHFQRSYSWGERQWERLWTDLLALPDDAPSRQHFIGPLVCASAPVVAGDSLNRFEVIDGQQRLTTLSALFGAMRDVARELGDDAMAVGITEDLLVHHRRKDGLRYRLVPRSDDRAVWHKLVDGLEVGDGTPSMIDDAWAWFRDQVRSIARRDGIDAVARLRFKAGQRLAFVSISISDENPYRVFESLNTSGLALTEFDLVRNHLFMRVPVGEQQHFEESAWRAFEHVWAPASSGTKRGVWSKAATSFLRHFLMSRVGYFPQGETFLQFKAWADAQGGTPAEIVGRLMKPARLAADMRVLEQLRDSRQKGSEGADWPTDPRRRALLQIAFCDAGSAKPLVLELFSRREAGDIDEDTLLRCLHDLVSLLMRRALTGAKTKQYDKRFVEIARKLDVPIRESLHAEFHRLGWPTDGAFADALMHHPIYRADALKTRLLLEDLERAEGAREHVQLARLQIEHVLPQRLSGASAADWKEMLGEEWRSDHDRFVHTIGNLTLTGYNQVMSNHSFALKRDSLTKSKLSLNDYFKGRRRWDAECIRDRARVLSMRLAELYPVFGESQRGDDGGDSAESLERADRADRNRSFWEQVHERIEGIDPDSCDGVPTGKAYMVLRTKFRNFRMIPWIDRRDDSIGVMASFNGVEGDRSFATVRAELPAIERRFGSRVGERLRGRRGQASCFIVKEQGAGLGSPTGDARAADWLAGTVLRLRDAVYPSLEGAGAQLRGGSGRARRSGYHQWFSQLLETARSLTPLHASRSPMDGPWCTSTSGVARVEFTYWVARGHSRAELRLEPDRRDAGLPKRRFAWLLAHRTVLDREMPGLEWINDEAHDTCRITARIDGGYAFPKSEWPSIQRACIDAMIRLHAAFHPLIDSEEFRRL